MRSIASFESSTHGAAHLTRSGETRPRPLRVPCGPRRPKRRPGHGGPAHLKAGLCPETGVRTSAKTEGHGTCGAGRAAWGRSPLCLAESIPSLIREASAEPTDELPGAARVPGKQKQPLSHALRPSCPLLWTAGLGVAWFLPSPTPSPDGSKSSRFYHQTTPSTFRPRPLHCLVHTPLIFSLD